MEFIIWFFLIALTIASFQDLKRREVDNWLNLLILFSGAAFIVFEALFSQNPEVIFLGIFSFLVMFLLCNLFYYMRIFAGGDAKLLFALFAVFVSASFFSTIYNILGFVFFLFLAGGIYGLGWSCVLFFSNYNDCVDEMKRRFKDFKLLLIVGAILLFSGIIIWLSNLGVGYYCFLIGMLLLIGGFLMLFAKSIEDKSMIKKLKAEDLRPGDWLYEDVSIGKNKIKADWQGLSEEEINMLRRSKKKVKIKQGIPFVPSFLIAYIIWFFIIDIFPFFDIKVFFY